MQERGSPARGPLSACPNKPNCVSTQASRPSQKMSPLQVDPALPEPIQAVADIVAVESRTQILCRETNYLHATFTSRWLGFVDDVEFYFDATAGLMHFRSASRIGYSDMGANRQRMERLASLLVATGHFMPAANL
ncbi:MAG: DUF1499 domain-containing protein [Planctomycetales bacterium]|nr:DUF1499 domain-containing protein [Planctomycetales bacterium]